MIDLSQLPVSAVTIAFIASAAVIGIVGTRIAQIADRLADTTGWGEAVFGGVFLGASTSLPGIVMSVTAALDGHADLAFSNALGGIAAQTVFLAIADMFYRRANLEHAAASVPNMMQGALLLILLTAVLLFMTSPAIAVWGVHPGSLALLLAYVFAVRMIAAARQRSTWQAATTPETVLDQPENAQPPTRTEVSQLWLKFWVYAAVLAVAGFLSLGQPKRSVTAPARPNP
jgi:cation:H+ antiporter